MVWLNPIWTVTARHVRTHWEALTSVRSVRWDSRPKPYSTTIYWNFTKCPNHPIVPIRGTRLGNRRWRGPLLTPTIMSSHFHPNAFQSKRFWIRISVSKPFTELFHFSRAVYLFWPQFGAFQVLIMKYDYIIYNAVIYEVFLSFKSIIKLT